MKNKKCSLNKKGWFRNLFVPKSSGEGVVRPGGILGEIDVLGSSSGESVVPGINSSGWPVPGSVSPGDTVLDSISSDEADKDEEGTGLEKEGGGEEEEGERRKRYML